MAGGPSTKVIQVTNIAPQATKDHMQQLFQVLGKIEDIRLYPIARDAPVPATGRICYIKFEESSSVASAQHMSNTVFIDRVLICTPISSGVIPEEHIALEMALNGTLANGNNSFESKLPPEVTSHIEGNMPNQVIKTYDPKLVKNDLPEYPPLPVNFDERKIEETRRTILVLNVESGWRLEDLMEHFKRAGDVKYARFAETDNRQKLAMIEFCEQRSVISALKMQGSSFNGTHLNLYHSTQPITKPEAKSNEAAQREVEEAMNIVNNIQLSAVIDPALNFLDKVRNSTRSRSRSRSRSRTSYSRSKRSRSRRRSSSRRRRKRSTSRRKSRSRSRSRSKRRKRSSSRSRRSRSRSKDRRRRDRKKSRDRSRSRHKSSRNRSRSRDRRDRSKSRDRSRSRHRSERKKKREKRDERKSYSRSRSKSHTRRSPSREKAPSKKRSRASRSAERKLKKISEERVRDYDAEEKIGMDDNGCEKASSKSDNMDISP